MSCNSISAITKLCGASVVPGSEKLWLIAYKDLIEIGTSGKVYNVGTSSNLVDNINCTQSYAEIGFLRDSAGFDSEGTIDPLRGVAFSTNTLSFKLGDLSVENQLFLANVMTQPVSALIKLRTGKYYVLGLAGQLQMSAFTATSGRGPGDEVSYTITFNEIDGIVPRQVDPTIVNGLIT